jgi:tetratricopeptide (TPR) repeat protein
MEEALAQAVQQHRLGNLQEAGRTYQAILAQNPNHPDALHLLGLVAHQMGQYQQAVQLITRAIALRPGVAAYYSNLAEVWRNLGQTERAIEYGRTALHLQPEYPQASNNLGLALLQSGNKSEAIEHFRTALRLEPNFAMGHNNLANALREQGDLDGAIDHFRKALQCEPRMAEALSNLGQLLCERRKLTEALPYCQKAVELRPDFAEAQSNLGNVLREMGRLDEARQRYQEALRLNPRIGMIYNNMGQLLQEEGKVDEALKWYQQALEREPNSARIRSNLATALGEKELYPEAIAQFETALQLEPQYAEAHNGLGYLFQEQGRDSQAKAQFEEAIRLKPDFAPAHSNLGMLLVEHNEQDQAEECFRTALRHDPNHAGALAQLATLRRAKLSDEDLAALRRLVQEPDLADIKRAALLFGLAHVLDARGAYEETAEHLRKANALTLASRQKRGEAYDPVGHTKFVTEMMATCDRAFFERVKGFGLDSERPVFIVGLPRSGTTLVEQVLASHSRIFGAGELRYVREDFEQLPTFMKVSEPSMTCLGRIDRETSVALAQHHLDRLTALNADALRVVDKMPDNYMYLGMLATMFPRAKFIHCLRDVRDVGVSCWMTNFRSIRWANDPEHIASRFREYQRIMEHWRATLPVPLLEVSYEETVTDFEAVARRLVAWCEVEWEPACLEFHQTKRPVRTASLTQVRQPVYTRSVARWKHYESALGELFAKLSP